MASKQDNALPLVTHILGLFIFLIGPLVMLIAAEDRKTRNHVKKALNWHLSALIYGIVGIGISLVLTLVLVGFFLIFTIPLALYVMHFVFSIIAIVKAGEGELWNYPLSINFFDME